MAQNLHFAESASDYSEAAVGFMLNYSSLAESKKFLRMKIYIILTVFACMRNADVYEAKSSDASVMLASNLNPRCINVLKLFWKRLRMIHWELVQLLEEHILFHVFVQQILFTCLYLEGKYKAALSDYALQIKPV